MAWFRQKKERFHVALRETASSPAKRPVRFAPYLQPTHPERKGGAFPFQEFPRSKRIRQPTYPAREGASHFIDGTWYAAATLTNVLRCLRFGTVSGFLDKIQNFQEGARKSGCVLGEKSRHRLRVNLQHFGDIPNVVEPKFLNIGLYCGY